MTFFPFRRGYYASISESSPVGSEVIRVYATSLDTGVNAEVFYSIVGGNEYEKFSINPDTGERNFARLLFLNSFFLGGDPKSRDAYTYMYFS